MTSPSPGLVVGIGNRYRKDDGVGLRVARLIREVALDGVSVVEGVNDACALIETWDKSSTVFLIDCTVSGSETGKVYRFDALTDTIPADLFDDYSTHSLGIGRAIELARTLGKLPRSLLVYGIEGRDFSSGEGLSPNVESAAHHVAASIVAELSNIDG